MTRVTESFATGPVSHTIMGLIMSVLTSLAVTIINIGIIPNFFQMWFSIFLTTFTIGFPITIAVTPFVKNIADRITLSETV
jgi:hypothetical protein